MKREIQQQIQPLLSGPMREATLAMQARNQELALSTGKVPTYRLDVYGCQMNERDSETYAGLLDEMGFHQVGETETADWIVFVTCCVRENAEDKIYGHIGALSQMCAENGTRLILGGCMMQQPHVVEKLRKSYPRVRVVLGTHNIHRLPALMLQSETTHQRAFEIWEGPQPVVGALPAVRSDPWRAYVAINSGCDNFCTYCIVPHVRGRERSRPFADILDEIGALAASGCREITLLGQNVNSYGNDFGKKDSFADLLRAIEDIEGIVRVRFMTSHPKDLSDALIDAMRHCNKVCAHLHLPVQAGSNEVLERMNRRYTREHYLALVRRIRAEIPGITLSTDLIVGFPGETEEDFQQTVALVDEVKYDFAFMFLYSPRKGTPAAEWPDQVPADVASERFSRLLKLQTENATEKAHTLEGQILEVLCEGHSREDAAMWAGRTSGNRLVNFSAEGDPTGALIPVRIVRAGAFWLAGEATHD